MLTQNEAEISQYQKDLMIVNSQKLELINSVESLRMDLENQK